LVLQNLKGEDIELASYNHTMRHCYYKLKTCERQSQQHSSTADSMCRHGTASTSNKYDIIGNSRKTSTLHNSCPHKQC